MQQYRAIRIMMHMFTHTKLVTGHDVRSNFLLALKILFTVQMWFQFWGIPERYRYIYTYKHKL